MWVLQGLFAGFNLPMFNDTRQLQWFTYKSRFGSAIGDRTVWPEPAVKADHLSTVLADLYGAVSRPET
jgi:hypothetical protein